MRKKAALFICLILSHNRSLFDELIIMYANKKRQLNDIFIFNLPTKQKYNKY